MGSSSSTTPQLENLNGGHLDVEFGTALPTGSTGLISTGLDATSVPRALLTAADGTLRIDPTGTTPQAVVGTGAAGVPAGGVLSVQGVVSGQALPVSAAALPLPAGAATSANQATEITSLQLLDDVPAGMNTAFNKASPIAGQLDDAATTSATEDNVAPVRVTALRALHANLRNNAGTEVGVAAAPLRTDPTGTTTQPVSAAALPLPTGAATEATLAKLTVAQGSTTAAETGPLVQGAVATAAPAYTTGQTSPLSLTLAGALRTDASATTQPVSGTVTANIGTTGGLALDTTLATQSLVDNAPFTDGTTRVVPAGYIFDETAGTALTENDIGAARFDSKRAQIFALEDATTRGQRLSVSAAGAAKVDGSAVTQPISAAALPLPTGAATESSLVKLTVAQGTALGTNTQALVGGSVTASAPTYVTGQINPLSLTLAGALRTDSSAVTQPVSGTVTANIGTTNGLALDATLTGGSQKAIIRGGAKGATTAADVTSTAEGADHQALDVQVYFGGTAKDPTAIRALTSADVITVNQGAAAAGTSRWPIAVTDTSDTVVRPGDAVNNAVRVNIVAGTGGGSAQIDKTTFTEGVANFTPVGGVFNETITSDPTEDQAAAARITAKRALHANLRTAAGAELLGQKTAVGSVPVVIASDQASLPVAFKDTNGGQAYATPFGEMRVASPFTLANLINKYEIDTREWGTSVATGGTVTHVPLQSAIQLAVTGTSGSQAILRTHTFFRYDAGRALRWRVTGYHADTGHANQTRRWGFYDPSDGVFFQLAATTLGVCRRSFITGAAVDTVVAQASWNVDKLDGTGTSGVTLDVTKGNIYEADFQWLGVGQIQYYVNGILVHRIANQNTIAGPWMRTAQLPLSAEVVNTGASTATSFTAICGSVQLEGGESPPEYAYCAFNNTDVSVTTVERPLLSIQPKLLYNSITNRMLILPCLAICSTEGARAGYRLVINGTLTGASFTSVDAQSGVEFDTAASALSGGQTILRGFLPNANDCATINLKEYFQRLGRKLRLDAFGIVQDVLTVMMVNEAAGTTQARASLTYEEVR